jgi:hypothetical protein
MNAGGGEERVHQGKCGRRQRKPWRRCEGPVGINRRIYATDLGKNRITVSESLFIIYKDVYDTF